MKTLLSYLKWFFQIILWYLRIRIKPQQGVKVVQNYYGYLAQAGIPVALLKFATLKWVDKKGNYTDDKGDYISYKHSIFGDSFILYEINRIRYWRYSYCKYNKTLDRFIELHLGYNDERPVIRFKIKKGELKY
jgi:hypothetical protein